MLAAALALALCVGTVGDDDSLRTLTLLALPLVVVAGKVQRLYDRDENVLRGEMSLVGPRPLVCDEDEQIVGWDRRRLQLTPGMTGRWQVLGSSRVPLAEMVKLDYLYVAGWSLWSDVKILLRTLAHVGAGRGQ